MPMTVGDLREILLVFNDDDLVVLARDEEGYDVIPVLEADRGIYLPCRIGGRAGTLFSENDDPEIIDRAMAAYALCLYPVSEVGP